MDNHNRCNCEGYSLIGNKHALEEKMKDANKRDCMVTQEYFNHQTVEAARQPCRAQ